MQVSRTQCSDLARRPGTGDDRRAAMNYTSLSEICDNPGEVADALEHAEGERGHAAALGQFRRLLVRREQAPALHLLRLHLSSLLLDYAAEIFLKHALVMVTRQATSC
jgi:hypothetical protein